MTAMHRVTLVTTGLLLTAGETAAGYRFVPYSKARAYDAMALRLSGVLNDIFNFHYAFAEEFRAPFDQADPIGLIVSPWIGAPDFSVAKDQAEKEIADLLPFVEFAWQGQTVCLRDRNAPTRTGFREH